MKGTMAAMSRSTPLPLGGRSEKEEGTLAWMAGGGPKGNSGAAMFAPFVS